MEGYGYPIFHNADVVNVKGELPFHHLGVAATKGDDYPAPIGVVAMDCRS